MTLGPVHAITDDRVAALPDVLQRARALAQGGASLHARGHQLGGRRHYELASAFVALAPDRAFVNDRVDVALALGAAGVVLGERSLTLAAVRRLLGPDRVVGCSVHDPAAASEARQAGADFVVFGPVFATATHPGVPGQGPERLAEVVATGVPVIAIGGITLECVPAVRDAGAAGVAAIRALWDAEDPERIARAMGEVFNANHRQR